MKWCVEPFLNVFDYLYTDLETPKNTPMKSVHSQEQSVCSGVDTDSHI